MRYVVRQAKPRANWIDDDGPLIPQISVDDNEAVSTGLFNLSGDPIMRLLNPIGFGRDNEW